MATATPFPLIEPGAGLCLAWQVKNKPVLIVGGGVVAAGRLSALLAAGAIVTLISPRSGLSPEVAWRIDEEKSVAIYHDRVYGGEEDLEGMEMVLTAIDEQGLSSTICEVCRRKRIAVNVADVPPECDFYFGSMVRRGPLQIMVSTGGAGPRIAARIRKAIEGVLPENVGDAIKRVGELRGELRRRVPGKDKADIERRMEWMIRVCDKWSLDQLAAMDDATLARVLEGWESGVANGYWDTRSVVGGKWLGLVGFGRCPARESPDGRAMRCPFVLGTSSMLVGVATALVGLQLWSRFGR